MNRKGVTLVEIIIATLVLALMATGFFSVFLSGRAFVQRSKRRVLAVEIARQEVEKMRHLVKADTWYLGNATDPLNPTGIWTAWNTTPTGNSVTFPGYSVRYRIDPGPGSAGYRKVSVQVRID